MSLHTCELSDANPFDYLTQLQRHASDLAESRRNWMPWNHFAALAQLGYRCVIGNPQPGRAHAIGQEEVQQTNHLSKMRRRGLGQKSPPIPS
jgi:hypothetical protein